MTKPMQKRYSITLRLLLVIWVIPGLPFNTLSQIKRIGKIKPHETITDAGLTAFRVGNLWGVYNENQKKVIAPTQFRFALPTPYGFLAATSDGVAYYNRHGKPVTKPAYQSLGFTWNQANEFLIFYNDSVAAGVVVTDSLGEKWVKSMAAYSWTGNHLHNLHGRLLSIYENEVMVNHYDFTRLNDSSYREISRSGVYEMNLLKWVIPPENNYLVRLGKLYAGTFAAGTKMFPQAYHYRIYNEQFIATHVLANPATHLAEPSEIKKLIPFADVKKFEIRNGPFTQGGLYYYETNAGGGLFQLDYLRLILPPAYDAILSPESTLYMVTLSKNKFGFIDPYSSGSVFEARYDSLFIGGLRDHENTASGMLLNGKWHVLLYKNAMETVTDSVWKDFRYPYCSVWKKDDFVFLEDVIPVFYSPYPYKIMRNGNTVDSLDKNSTPVYPVAVPARYLSGVFGVSSKKWIVPKKYERVGRAGMYLFGAMADKNLWLIDLYDESGKLVLPNFSAEMNITSSVIWAGITQTDEATRKGKVECDNSTRHALHNAVYIQSHNKTGVFDLVRMKWIIDPVYTEIVYINDWAVFKAMRNINGKKIPVWFDDKGNQVRVKTGSMDTE
jgi:hypothetical protein